MANSRLLSAQWYGQLAKVTRFIGQPSFVEAFFEALGTLAPTQGVMIYAFTSKGLPLALAERSAQGPWRPEGSLAHYLQGHYLLCPFYRAITEGAAPGCYQLADVAPDHFRRSEYYLSFYQHSRLEDEVNYFVPFGEQVTVVVELASTKVFSAAQVRDLKCIAPWVIAVVSQHWAGLGSQPMGGPFESQAERQINSALSHFGASLLTERECAIVQLLLRGYSSKALAQRLGVAEDTIKSHRKNIYTKLDISRHSELFSLFINALALAREALGQDPLALYMARRR
ncbi:DNA-binding CsgD family transcriptional regulator [Pseudomonas oryzihabitans]